MFGSVQGSPRVRPVVPDVANRPRWVAVPRTPTPTSTRTALALALAVALATVATWCAAAPPDVHASPHRGSLDEGLVVAARLPAAAPALDIAVNGDRAFVAAHGVGVHILDIADPHAPVMLGTFSTAGTALAVAADNNVLAVATGTAGLQIFARPDVEAVPVLVGVILPAPGGKAYSVAVSGDIVWVGEWNEDFENGDPGHGIRAVAQMPDKTWRVIGGLTTPGWAADIAIDNLTAYVADGPGGLRIIDIADPTAPHEVGSFATSVRAYGIAVDGATKRAYIADNSGGLVIVDVSDPAAPKALGSLATAGAAYDVAFDAEGQRVWIAQADGGGPADGGRVTLVDVRRPAAPVTVDEIVLAQRAWGVALGAGDRAWVAATGSGVIGLERRLIDPPPTETSSPGPSVTPTAFATPDGSPAGRVHLPWASR